jgi:hypothetical protein
MAAVAIEGLRISMTKLAPRSAAIEVMIAAALGKSPSAAARGSAEIRTAAFFGEPAAATAASASGEGRTTGTGAHPAAIVATTTLAAAAAASAKSAAVPTAAMADENDGTGGAGKHVFQIDRRRGCRRRSLDRGQEKQTARQSGHSRHGYSHNKFPYAWRGEQRILPARLCTGSWIYGALGLLDGKPATNRKELDRLEASNLGKVPINRLAEIAPKARISRARVLDAGRIITTAASPPAWKSDSICSAAVDSTKR